MLSGVDAAFAGAGWVFGRIGAGIRAVFSLPGLSATRQHYGRFARALGRAMPKGLYPRSLIIIIAPMVLLQAVVAFVFMERHYLSVTSLLSAATTRDIAMVLDLLGEDTSPEGTEATLALARERLLLNVTILPGAELPPVSSQPFFTLLDETLARQIEQEIGLPFWIDTVGASNLVEIRIALPERVVRIFAQRGQTYESNSQIFIIWMVGTSLVLIVIAVLFLRNQIVPIQRLADAAESFGKGRPAPEFRPRGAREVRRASAAFIEMQGRIVRQIEQRTTMLAGVSHDLRTILTRFRLQLELLGSTADSEDLRQDIDDMHRMLEEYLAFASGDGSEQPVPTAIPALLERVIEQFGAGQHVTLTVAGSPKVMLRPLAFRRCIGNLVANAVRHAEIVAVTATHAGGWLTVLVDDDGPGIPEAEREAVFRPFHRLDTARNLEYSGTGLGLAIARDIARGHGGDITMSESPLGGLRATVRVPG
ncbi:MAG: two-component sensor histidine kinase [Bauldia sp.]|nr:two-component sensor histidine kinase [Bauldia sp.]